MFVSLCCSRSLAFPFTFRLALRLGLLPLACLCPAALFSHLFRRRLSLSPAAFVRRRPLRGAVAESESAIVIVSESESSQMADLEPGHFLCLPALCPSRLHPWMQKHETFERFFHLMIALSAFVFACASARATCAVSVH